MGVEERVRQLIKESDLTHTEFGARIGLEKTKLSKSLAGRRRFTFLELALAAQQGGVTVDWLLTGTEDDFATAARTGADEVGASASLSRARELTNLREALEGFGFPQQIRFEAGDLKGNRWALQGIELAKRLRHSFHSPVEQAANLATLIETDLGVDVAIQPLGRLDGLAVTTGSARLILAATSVVPTRQRFTLAYELGHLAASDDQQLHTDENVYTRDGEGEMRANAFATELLMPEAALADRVHRGSRWFEELTWELRVSPTVLAHRLGNLKLIDEAERDRLLTVDMDHVVATLGRQQDYAARVAEASQPRIPTLLLCDLLAAHRQGHTTLLPVAALMGMPADDLRAQLTKSEGE
mgnify:FL=1